MIKFAVPIYPDESVYSWLARIYLQSGIATKIEFFSSIYKNHRKYPDLIFAGGFNDEFLNYINKVVGYEKLMVEHTLLKYYIRFLDYERKRAVFDLALHNNCGIQNLVAVEMGKRDYYLRYCPLCASEDRDRYGEAYYHITHQFPKVHICSKHCCRLINTGIKVVDYRYSLFIPLEEVIGAYNIETVSKKSVEYKISKYINELFKYDICLEKNCETSTYLISRLDEKYIRDTTCQRNNELLIKDLLNFYKDLNGYQMNINRLQGLLCGNHWNSYEISLLALFEKISPQDLAMFKGKNQRTKRKIEWKKYDKEACIKFDKLVMGFVDIDKLGITNKWVCEKLKIKLRHMQHLPLLRKKIRECKSDRVGWDIIDKQYCERLSFLLKTEMKTFSGKIITKSFVASILGVKDSTLRRLPKLRNFVFDLEKAINSKVFYHKT